MLNQTRGKKGKGGGAKKKKKKQRNFKAKNEKKK